MIHTTPHQPGELRIFRPGDVDADGCPVGTLIPQALLYDRVASPCHCHWRLMWSRGGIDADFDEGDEEAIRALKVVLRASMERRAAAEGCPICGENRR